jgi:hypothetical protein
VSIIRSITLKTQFMFHLINPILYPGAGGGELKSLTFIMLGNDVINYKFKSCHVYRCALVYFAKFIMSFQKGTSIQMYQEGSDYIRN